VENHYINIQLFERPAEPVDVTIYDMVGAKVYYNRFQNTNGLISFRVSATFSRETHYILEAKYGATVTREQVIFKK
jgi:hypothetical protein